MNNPDSLDPIRRVAEHLEIRRRVNEDPKPGANEGLVIDDHNADHNEVKLSIGNLATTRKPPPRPGPANNDPPNRVTRRGVAVRPKARRRPPPGQVGIPSRPRLVLRFQDRRSAAVLERPDGAGAAAESAHYVLIRSHNRPYRSTRLPSSAPGRSSRNPGDVRIGEKGGAAYDQGVMREIGHEAMILSDFRGNLGEVEWALSDTDRGGSR